MEVQLSIKLLKPLSLLLFLILGTIEVSAQNKVLDISEKVESNNIFIYAKNNGPDVLEVQYDIEQNGLTFEKETPFSFQLKPNEEKLILEMKSNPSLAWSYKHRIGYRPLKKEIVVAKVAPVDPVIAKIETTNNRDKEIAALKKTPTFEEQEKITGSPGLINSVKVTEIIVYSKETCGRCQYLTKSLRNKQIQYKEWDIEKDVETSQEMWHLLKESGFEGESITTPVIILNGQLYYNIDDLVDFTEKLKK